MRICILSSFEDSMQKDTGYSVRTFNLAKSLAESGNEVDVILPKDKFSRETVAGVTVYSLRGFIPKTVLEVLKKIMGITRPTAIYFYDLLFAFRVLDVIGCVDVVQFEQQSVGALLIPLIRKVLKKPVVLDCHDVFQASRLKYTSMLRRATETLLEKRAYKHADLILTVSEKEKKLLVSAGVAESKIKVVPNGVDTKFFVRPIMQAEHAREIRKRYCLEDSRIIIFVGNLDYLPNREAVEILSYVIAPRIFEEVGNAKFIVAGKSSEKIMLPGLTFTGFVKDLPEILSVSDVAVAPLLHGSGTRLKILEYFSCALPVVSTSIGADGLGAEDGVNIFIEDNLQSFASRVVDLLRNVKLAAAAGDAARTLVTSNYDWTQIAVDLEVALNNLLSNN